MNVYLMVTVSVLMLSLTACSPKLTSVSNQNESVQSVIDKYLNQIGCKNGCAEIKSAELYYSMSMMGMDMKVLKIQNEQQGYFNRIGTDYRVFFEQIFNGTQALEKHTGGTDTYTSGEKYDLMKSHSVYLPQRYYSDSRYQIKDSGRDTLADKSCHIVSVTTPEGITMLQYYDNDSGLLLRQKLNQLSEEGKNISLIEDYRDYRTYENIRMPSKITTSGIGPSAYDMTLDSVFFNRKVDSEYFKID